MVGKGDLGGLSGHPEGKMAIPVVCLGISAAGEEKNYIPPERMEGSGRRCLRARATLPEGAWGIDSPEEPN